MFTSHFNTSRSSWQCVKGKAQPSGPLVTKEQLSLKEEKHELTVYII